MDVFRLRAEFSGHGANGGRHDSGGRPSPSRVDGRDGAAHGIGEKHGNAIGSLDSNGNAGRVLDQRVSIFLSLRRALSHGSNTTRAE